MQNNLIPTAIVDKNGKQTTVHKKMSGAANGRSLPGPSLKSRVTGLFSNKEKTALLTAVNEDLSALSKFFNPSDRELIMSKVKKVGDVAYLTSLDNVLNRVTKDEQDCEFLYDMLSQAEAKDSVRLIHVAGNHLGVLEENPGSLERLYRLDLILTSNEKDPLGEVDTLEAHFRAKLDYPFLGDRGHSIEYEMSTAYFRSIQENPDLAGDLMQFVHTLNREDLTQKHFDLFLGIHRDMPEHVEKLNALLPNCGINDIMDFMEERDCYQYDKEVVAGFFNTANAVNEGWL